MVRTRGAAGFTLVEAMVAVVILGIAAGLSGRLLIQANRFFVLTRARTDLQRESRAAMYVIDRELRQAQAGTIQIDRLSPSQPYCSRITFTKVQGTTMTFQQNGPNLVQIAGNDVTTLSSHLFFLAFLLPRSDDLSTVSISLTLQEGTYATRTTALHSASQKVKVMN